MGGHLVFVSEILSTV